MSFPLEIVINARNNASAVMQQVMASMGEMSDMGSLGNDKIKDSFIDLRRETRLQNSAINTLGMSFRNEYRSAFQFSDALSHTGAVFGRLTSAFQQFNVMSIRQQQASDAVSSAQDRVNLAVSQYGAGSQQATVATKQLTVAQENLVQVQKQNQVGTAGLIIQTGLQLPTALFSAAEGWKKYITNIGGVTTAMLTLGPVAAVGVTAIAGIIASQEEFGRISAMESNKEIENLRSLAQHYREGGRSSAAYWLEQKANVIEASTAIAQASETTMQVYERFFPTKAPTGYAQYMDALNAANERMRIAAETAPIEYSIPVNADTSQAQTQVSLFQSLVNGLKGMLGIDADTSAAQSAAGALAASIAGMHPTIDVELRYRPGMLNIPYFPGGEPPPYQHGTPFVPQTGLALLHRGEAVIPASMNMPTTMYNQFNNNMDVDLFLAKFNQQLVSAYRKVTG